MDFGIPQSILTPFAGEMILNDLTGETTGDNFSNIAVPCFPTALSDGNGWLLQSIKGGDGAPLRNPVENRPHKDGGIMHTFRRGPLIYTLEGLTISSDPASRFVLDDWLRGITDDIKPLKQGRHFFTPPSQDTRFRTVHLYEPITIADASEKPGPKPFTITLIAPDPIAYRGVQDLTAIADGATEAVPNEGNTGSWPVVKVYGPSAGFVFSDETLGFEIVWAGSLASGHYIEFNFFNETAYLDGSGARKFAGINFEDSDFWMIPPGGTTMKIDGAGSATVLSNWAYI